ncbi:MAG: D-alanyl-D-alanine carboxypeptidase [Fimbriimonadaceae bacterium]|nr:D-alanyl-D-alanine carboxypeptidase [Fimbriimonadaceae bacterium]QYK55131.1 MAG: D-alanyl-D-alanine carboxypeptidase [Fimbriimonadaceae bacterium]
MFPLLVSLAQDALALDEVFASPALKNAALGVCVLDRNGNTVYNRNADMLLVPASNQKVFTVLFALSRLSLDEQPLTRFWKEEGSIFVDAPGDPDLSRRQLLEAKKSLGVTPGTPIKVREAYHPGFGPDWELDDIPWYYAAPTYAFAFDKGVFDLTWDGKKMIQPPEQRLTFSWVGGDGRFDIIYDPQAKTASLKGSPPRRRAGFGKYAMAEPDASAARLLGGELVRTNEEPPLRPPDFSVLGKTFEERAQFCLERSDNFVAEHLLMRAALAEGPMPEDCYPTAAARLHTFLVSEVGLDPSEVRPMDGSGLSRHNYATARALCRAYLWANDGPNAATWRKLLAAPGEGTLRSRLLDCQFFGKTGTLDAVSTLTGLLITKDGRELAVAILMNGPSAKGATLHAIQDRFVKRLEQGR